MTKHRARIIGLGSYLPSQVLTNQDLEKMVKTSNEWIVTRTGIEERRLADKDEFPSTMGAKAAKRALKACDLSPSQIDLIIVATMTPDYISPSTAALLQHQIGAHKAVAFDIQAACTGFLYAISSAKAYIESGLYQTVLVVASEKMSAFIDYEDRNTCVLFGDGAAAAVISASGAGLAIDTICLGADGGLAELLMIPGGGSREPPTPESLEKRQQFIKMSGRELFKHAVRRMSSAAQECLQQGGVTEQDISWVVPHQANVRILDAIAKALNLPDEKIYKTLQKYGNTSASSIAIALDELMQEHPLKRGERLLLLAFGGGLTWGAALLHKID